MPEAIVPKKESKPWKEICSKRCWFAKHDRCRCKCGKQNHGKGFKKKTDKKDDERDKP
jgi:hypothetical protein